MEQCVNQQAAATLKNSLRSTIGIEKEGRRARALSREKKSIEKAKNLERNQ